MMWTSMIAALMMNAAAAQIAPFEQAALDDRAVSRSSSFADFADLPRFGARGSRRWQIHGGGGVDIKRSRNTLGYGGLGVSYFIIDNLSLDAELNAMYVSQIGDDAVAGNFNFLFRWHFLPFETWSLYAEAGAGMLLATERVPHNGSRFNFTPQAGLGASIEIGPDTRLMTGLRLQHISNANLYSDNPGRDSVMAYVGVSFGF